MARKKEEETIVLESVSAPVLLDGVETILLHTNVGDINSRYHAVPDAEAAVIWVGGAGGGLDGPAWGMYPRLAQQLTKLGIASLRIDYRYPNDLQNCVIDTLIGLQYLVYLCNHRRIALAGHSFGGAVVITAGALGEEVVAVAALSSQTYGTGMASQLSPKALLLMHGTADEILPHACSEQIYQRANEPKELKLYPNCRHGLDECRDQVDAELVQWLTVNLKPGER